MSEKDKERRDSASNSEEFASVTTSIRDSQRNSNDTRVSSSQSSVRQSTNVSSTSRTSKLQTKSGKVDYKEVENRIEEAEKLLKELFTSKSLIRNSSLTLLKRNIGDMLIELSNLPDDEFGKKIYELQQSLIQDRKSLEENVLCQEIETLDEKLNEDHKEIENRLNGINDRRRSSLFFYVILYFWAYRAREKKQRIEEMVDSVKKMTDSINTLKSYYEQSSKALKNATVKNLLGADNPFEAKNYAAYGEYRSLLQLPEGTVNEEEVKNTFNEIARLIEKDTIADVDRKGLPKELRQALVSSEKDGISKKRDDHKEKAKLWEREIKILKAKMHVLNMDLQRMRVSAVLVKAENSSAQKKRKKDIKKAEELIGDMNKRISRHKAHIEEMETISLEDVIFPPYNPFDKNIDHPSIVIYNKVTSDSGELEEEKVEEKVEKIQRSITPEELNAANEYEEKPGEKEKDIEGKAKKLLGKKPNDVERLSEKFNQIGNFNNKKELLKKNLKDIKVLRKIIHADLQLTRVKETDKYNQPSATRDKKLKLYSLLRKMDVIEENINLFLAFNTMRTKVMEEQPDKKPLNIVQIARKRTMGAASAFTKSVIGSMYGGSVYEGSECGDGESELNSQYSDFPDNERNNSLYLDDEEDYENEAKESNIQCDDKPTIVTEFEKKEDKRKVKKGMFSKFFGNSKTNKNKYQEGQVRVYNSRFPLPKKAKKTRKKRFGLF